MPEKANIDQRGDGAIYRPFCVTVHIAHFLSLLVNGLDIVVPIYTTSNCLVQLGYVGSAYYLTSI